MFPAKNLQWGDCPAMFDDTRGYCRSRSSGVDAWPPFGSPSTVAASARSWTTYASSARSMGFKTLKASKGHEFHGGCRMSLQ